MLQCTGCVSASARPHQLCWGDWECAEHWLLVWSEHCPQGWEPQAIGLLIGSILSLPTRASLAAGCGMETAVAGRCEGSTILLLTAQAPVAELRLPPNTPNSDMWRGLPPGHGESEGDGGRGRREGEGGEGRGTCWL